MGIVPRSLIAVPIPDPSRVRTAKNGATDSAPCGAYQNNQRLYLWSDGHWGAGQGVSPSAAMGFVASICKEELVIPPICSGVPRPNSTNSASVA